MKILSQNLISRVYVERCMSGVASNNKIFGNSYYYLRSTSRVTVAHYLCYYNRYNNNDEILEDFFQNVYHIQRFSYKVYL